VMFALIFNAITSTAAYAGVGSNEMLFCTSQGYQWIKVEDQTSSSERAQQHCKLCLFPASEDNVSDADVSTARRSLFIQSVTQSFKNVYPLLKARFAKLIAQGRAPPINTLI